VVLPRAAAPSRPGAGSSGGAATAPQLPAASQDSRLLCKAHLAHSSCMFTMVVIPFLAKIELVYNVKVIRWLNQTVVYIPVLKSLLNYELKSF